MRRLLSLLPLLLAAVLASGCPLDIQIRCDDSAPCAVGEACVAGACLPIRAERVGEACASQADCGAGLTCATGFPGGYCLTDCTAGAPCPGDTVCVPELRRCLRPCGETCTRPGYTCMPLPQTGSPTRACAPSSGGTPVEPGTDAPDGGTGTPPRVACSTDFQCATGSRCEDSRCVVGSRIGEPCTDSWDCAGFVMCNAKLLRCEQRCANDSICEPGYRCGPDGLCVERCTDVPSRLGQACADSLECTRCGVCVGSEGARVCRMPCMRDSDCPGQAVGSCEAVGSWGRACRL